MKKLLAKLALLLLPVALYLAFFVAFEPNDYFGLKGGSASTAPIARIKAFAEQSGQYVILGDSRLAHFDLALADSASGKQWQNLAFGGASLKETLDLADYVLDSGADVREILFGLSFYTLNANYNADRMTALEDTLQNPAAYCLNLEYNVNTLTAFSDWLAGREDIEETGDWTAADYLDANGNTLPLHRTLYDYPATIYPKCEGWALSEQAQRLPQLAERCRQQGVKLTIVLPPMSDNVRTEVCRALGIDAQMAAFLPTLHTWAAEYGFTVLDYEWANPPVLDDDTQFYDGFHLDTRHGLPQWTTTLFSEL